ncbi:MAG TPA: NUDIX domain-containing protein [Candidatus Saccharimonadales bacterium]
MNQLLTISNQDFDPQAPQLDSAYFRERRAARAVLLDSDGQVYLINVSKHNYHKLPGGGIDEGEEVKQALERELMEEVGCKAEIIAELGQVVEFRGYKDDGLKQTSYCYLAKQLGEQGEATLEDDELEKGMFAIKAKSIDHAIALVGRDQPGSLDEKFMQKRDLCFLKAAKSYVAAVAQQA